MLIHSSRKLTYANTLMAYAPIKDASNPYRAWWFDSGWLRAFNGEIPESADACAQDPGILM
jgi:hypothetical protein